MSPDNFRSRYIRIFPKIFFELSSKLYLRLFRIISAIFSGFHWNFLKLFLTSSCFPQVLKIRIFLHRQIFFPNCLEIFFILSPNFRRMLFIYKKNVAQKVRQKRDISKCTSWGSPTSTLTLFAIWSLSRCVTCKGSSYTKNKYKPFLSQIRY